MNKPKIIFIDLDGTAMDAPAKKWYNKRPSNYTKEVIAKLSKTIPVVVATGRGVNDTTWKIINSLNMSDFIAWNGAQIIRNKEVVHKEIIPASVIEKLYQVLTKNKCWIIFNSNFDHLTFVKRNIFKWILKLRKTDLKLYSEFKNDFPIYKVLASGVRQKKIQKIHDELREIFKDDLEVAFSGSKNLVIEITKKTASKGIAEQNYCKMLGIDPQDAIHIGDSMNDASAKGKVGKLVAMKNSTQKLKDIADEITEYTCDEQGLAKYLEQFL
ncbi:Cof-type HAD-IIB family hydrolase [Mycoplasmopsis gallopavonis]|uniref:COF family HAD hydrolase protein n=1 Tax=Mycoplasmopsis gallopavonis TaxID=76629 RepID=A0A449AZM7_9BACT|nr:Cof-type HAD-IIB family hydrolase [Mycoplasmopsis gallopavonis]RIV16338.1 Cof-type HAD-IIB family hydrolase [Mycoplasmopsis gallopavonis]VEU72947.1 COF family HAD hydrolase protein [Mycoplasmopsis gallopavonis]